MQWGVRAGLALLAVVGGYYATAFSVAQAVAERDPALAHRLAPYDGQTAALLASTLALQGASESDRRSAVALARQALRQDPTAVRAVSVLGLDAQLRGDTAAARRLFAYGNSLSRREITTQLWAIEDAVARSNVGEALDHYDIALRTKPSMTDILFPILASASEDADIRSGVVKKLVAGPWWRDDFITHMAASNVDPGAIAALFLELGQAGVAIPEASRARAVNALIDARRLDAAWAYYSANSRGADRRRSRDPRFSATFETPSAFDWVPINNGTINTSIQHDGNDAGVFTFTTPSSGGGSMLQQSQLLPPGQYRLSGRSSGDPLSLRSYWVLTCGDGRELGRVELGGQKNDGSFLGSFTVPTGCPIQALTLMASPVASMSPFSGQIEQVQLEPMP